MTTHTKRLALIEDDKNFSEVLSNLLEYSGYQVKTAFGGAEGWELINSWNPEVVLCDVNMPGFSGMDVLTQLRKSEQKVMPFIFMSGEGDIRNIRKGMNQGADDFLTKPFSIQDLIQSIETRIQRKFELSQQEDLDIPNSLDDLPIFADEKTNSDSDSILDVSTRINKYVSDCEQGIKAQIEANIISTTGKAVIETLNHSGRLKDLEMDLDPGNLAANEDLFAKAISEILKNCIENSEPGTPIRIKGISESRYYKLLISDEGKCLSELELRNIRNYKPYGKGSGKKPGLGIALSSKIMKTFKGSLNFDKNEPQGLQAILLCPKTKNNK